MKKIKDLLLLACAYTVLISTLFFLFVSVDTAVAFKMTFSSFSIIFGMSCLIAAAKLIFEIESFPYYVRLIIHFITLLALMLVLLWFTGYLIKKKATDYFIIIAAYTFIYAVISLISFGIRKLIASISKKNAPRATAKAPHNSAKGVGTKSSSSRKAQNKGGEKKKSEYKPLYK
ncbi:MAG: DUF3021 family protein [Clostridia bacterium]|nr:DUF3021 family protein [Clostridia bacterium]